MTYYQMVRTKTGWRRYGSGFLALAILLNLLGVVISPIQQIFLSSSTVKTPTRYQEYQYVFDIPEKFYSAFFKTSTLEYGGLTVATRKLLETTMRNEKQPLIWLEGGGTPGACYSNTRNQYKGLSKCSDTGISLSDLSGLKNPFIAPLPQQFHTGLVQQFVPRINSTAQWANINIAEYPANCGQDPGSWVSRWSNTTTANDDYPDKLWSVEACMTGDLRTSPWKPTLRRQDFMEELYLNITIANRNIGDDMNSRVENSPPGGSPFRITMNTTAGHFELPNYMNGTPVAGW